MRKLGINPFISCLAVFLFLVGCGTTGQDFNLEHVPEIVKHETSKEDILRLFGSPHTKGIENGRDMWTYEYNKKYLGGKDFHKDLVLIFDDKGKVIAYSSTSNFP